MNEKENGKKERKRKEIGVREEDQSRLQKDGKILLQV
jgi:hypothetical protein